MVQANIKYLDKGALEGVQLVFQAAIGQLGQNQQDLHIIVIKYELHQEPVIDKQYSHLSL